MISRSECIACLFQRVMCSTLLHRHRGPVVASEKVCGSSNYATCLHFFISKTRRMVPQTHMSILRSSLGPARSSSSEHRLGGTTFSFRRSPNRKKSLPSLSTCIGHRATIYLRDVHSYTPGLQVLPQEVFGVGLEDMTRTPVDPSDLHRSTAKRR